MNEVAYSQYIQQAKKADELYYAIRELYGEEIPWRQAYIHAVKNRLLTAEDKDLIRRFHPPVK